MATRPRSRVKPLTVREIQTAVEGEHSDGEGLLLRVNGTSAQWVYRFTSPTGKRREMGLGSCNRTSATAVGLSLTAAREQARSARSLLQNGIDPIDHRGALRRAAKAEAEAKLLANKREQLTLARAARGYHERVIEPARSAKHSAQWISSLEKNVPADIWHKPIDQVCGPELLDALASVRLSKPETARRLLQRLGIVFDDCMFRGTCTTNPAHAIRKRFSEGSNGHVRGHFAALPYNEAPTFMGLLRAREGIAARALEFAVLTAARTGEVIGATWSEFDLDAALWTVPAARMKGGEEHRVVMPAAAVELLRTMLPFKQPYAFPNPRMEGRPLSNMAMLTLLRRMDAAKKTTVHGLARSTFSTWANELGMARHDVVEACLAHRESDRVRAAYNRAQFAQERADLLCKWAKFLDAEHFRNVFGLMDRRLAA